MPSISSVPRWAAMALRREFNQLVEVDRASLAPRRHVGRQRRSEAPGRDAFDVGRAATARPSAASSTPGSLPAAAAGSKPVTTGLSASTGSPAVRAMADQTRGDEGLADIGAGRGDEVTRSCVAGNDALANDRGKPRDLIVGMQRAENVKPQPRGLVRNRRRPDCNDQKAFVLEQPRRIERRPSASPITTGTIALCASGRPAAPVNARALASGRASRRGSRSIRSERGDRSSDDRGRQAGGIDQRAGAVADQLDDRL